MSEYWKQPYVPGGPETFDQAKERYGKLIKQSEIDHWHQHGYVVIERLFSPDELKELHRGLQLYMPTYENFRDHRPMFAGLSKGGEIPLSGSNAEIVRREWPFEHDALNYAGMHPFLVAFAERLRGSNDILMTHNAIVGKYAGKGDYDQALHTDHPHNTPVIPTRSNKHHDLPMLIYYSDVTIDLGPTYIVSWEHTEPQNLVNQARKNFTRQEMPELYEKEVPLVVPAGSAVIYSMRTWHRGSAMTAKEGSRFTQFTGFHANQPWHAPTNQMGTFGGPKMHQFLIRADPGQRALVGFPPVGHEFWNDAEVFEGLANRYPEMDLRPYGGPPPKVEAKGWGGDLKGEARSTVDRSK